MIGIEVEVPTNTVVGVTGAGVEAGTGGVRVADGVILSEGEGPLISMGW